MAWVYANAEYIWDNMYTFCNSNEYGLADLWET